jgi:hypothetical protein
MYNPKSKIRLLLFSYNTTMFAEIQGGNKWKQEVKPREDKRMVKLEFFLDYHFWHILKKSAHSLFECMVIPLDLHSITPSEGSKAI